MKISNKGIELIKKFEGYSRVPYRCSANRLTIGYGHIIKENEEQFKVESKKLTLKEAEELLKQDIEHFENYLNKIIAQYKIELTQNQYDALISFIFNTGYLKSAMIERLINHNLKEVANTMLLYDKANGKKLDGLTKRRKKEQELFFSS